MLVQFALMASENKFVKFIADRDWRIWLGIVVTIFWIAGGVWYVRWVIANEPTQDLTLSAVGSFLEGAFAPLAFLWLVLGLFIQQRELTNNTEALRRTSEQSEKQTHAIAATEMNARQGTFFQIADNVKSQLGGISGMLYLSSKGPIGDGTVNREQMDRLFNQVGSGDHSVFARLLISADNMEDGGVRDLLYGTEIRRRHTKNFMHTFDRLCQLAKNCDVDGIIEDSLWQSAFGLLYRRMQKYAPDSESDATNK